jgi:hypothetical protein
MRGLILYGRALRPVITRSLGPAPVLHAMLRD